ncbi:MAG: SprT-like domain-containing protein [Desulfobulbia bacterium]
MSTITNNKTDTEIQAAIRETGEHYYKLAEDIFNRTFERPKYSFNLRGTTAGTASMNRGEMRFNMHIAKTHFDKYMARTVPHEVAHMIDFALHGKSSHGSSWKNIMIRFGCEPSRCHSYDNLKTASGKDRPMVVCGCGERSMGPTRYKRMLQGTKYVCGKCKSIVRPLDGVKVQDNPLPSPKRTSRGKKVSVICGCGERSMGATQYRRMTQDGVVYTCRGCKQIVTT